MKKTAIVSLALCAVLLMQMLAFPVAAMPVEVPQTVPVEESVPAETESEFATNTSILPFGQLSVKNGCRSIEGMQPLGGSERMLETAQAAEFVRQKPGQLDDPVEQGGRNLSGGQKQRLTIARALVSKPDVLILDDSASALDYATDAALRRALRQLPDTTTTFIVSQRTSSIRHADQILVLEDGELVGCGTHDALLESCEVYREIHESQFRNDHSKGGAQA